MTELDDNALSLIQSWINASQKKVQIVPRIGFENKCETILGISEHSSLGTLTNHTGGLSVSNGIIRHYGGDNRYGLSIREVNELSDMKPARVEGILIVADDVYGGLFGINASTAIGKPGAVLYLPPDTYVWENLEIGHTAFLHWSINGDTDLFYKKYSSLDLPESIPFYKTVSFNPPLWSADLSNTRFAASQIDTKKSHAIRFGILRQLP